jgi:hypothetical protein
MNQTSVNPATLACRRYRVEFFVSMAAYAAVLFACVWLLKHAVHGGSLYYLLALLPVGPCAFAFAAVVRYLHAADELTRMVQLEALAISAGVTAMLSITYGFLEGVGFPHLSAWWTYAIVMVTWGLAVPIVARRYQ